MSIILAIHNAVNEQGTYISMDDAGMGLSNDHLFVNPRLKSHTQGGRRCWSGSGAMAAARTWGP